MWEEDEKYDECLVQEHQKKAIILSHIWFSGYTCTQYECSKTLSSKLDE